ncbi:MULTISPECIES: pyridoxine/pyridoxamine 5'-phosphate oxidase [Micrococcaceae]|uniref:Pyridoxal 5'-phosphate synthase n=1 Tax=Arthrobacter sedimenti TaxID=2694931 RepID=A0ABV8WKN4_9MICC|nr:pyridoxamine 5'-phosphate oxidase family protein [Pseudarthrobacter defluvii]WJH25838.1 pyridoxamine 5'-phosphate oxidase family protein [Pseudarthrobacter defluvii]
MSETFRKFLRTLPDFPSDLPGFDPENAPQDPALLFKQWLDEALDAGERQPHAFSLATVGAASDGGAQPSSRMLILKNIDDDGWHFATSRTSRKGRELAESPRAAMNFYWPGLGRQVRVVGAVTELSAESSSVDWHERPRADGSDNPDWQLYALQPAEIEFWQASNDRRHVRHRVSADGRPLG